MSFDEQNLPPAPPPPPAPGPTPDPAPTGAAPAPWNTRRNRILAGSIGAGVLLVVGAVVAHSVVNSTVYSPEKPVEAYLDSLEAGDVSEMMALADFSVPKNDRALLTDEVYQSVEGRPTDATINHVIVYSGGKAAAVDVSWTQDGDRVDESFSVYRTGSTGLFFDEWQLDAPDVQELYLGSVGSSSVVVNGVEVPVSRNDATLHLLPGDWDLTLPEPGEYQSAPTIRYQVRGGMDYPSPVAADDGKELLYSVAPAALDAAEELAQEYVDHCFESTAAEPQGCGMWSWEEDLEGLRWTQTTAPRITARSDTRDSVTVAVEDGEATVTGTLPADPEQYRDADEAYEEADPFGYTLTYRFVDGDLVLDADEIW